MKTWDIGWNTYYKSASYGLEEGPWWAFVLCWLAYAFHPHFLHHIKFPAWGRIYNKEENKYYNWREWFGDVGSWWTTEVEIPLHAFAFRFIHWTSAYVEYDAAKLDQPKYWARLQKWTTHELEVEGQGLEKGCPDSIVASMKKELAYHERECERLKNILKGR